MVGQFIVLGFVVFIDDIEIFVLVILHNVNKNLIKSSYFVTQECIVPRLDILLAH